jgi:hypothetical protein
MKESSKKMVEYLYNNMGSDKGRMIIHKMVARMEEEDEVEEMMAVLEGEQEFHNFMTEDEARDIVSKFINFDKSRGGKWTNIEIIIDELRQFGGVIEERKHYNRWVLYVFLNKQYSDYGGVIGKLIQRPDDMVKICYMMALADIDDPDRNESIREEFDLE